MIFDLDPNAAMHFLSLKKGDVVQLTLAPGKTGLEEFWQLSRANGAKPRSPVELTAADMEWLGLAAKVSPADGPGCPRTPGTNDRERVVSLVRAGKAGRDYSVIALKLLFAVDLEHQGTEA